MHPRSIVPAFRLRQTQAAAEQAAAAMPKRKAPLRGRDGKFKSAKRRRTKTKSKGA